MNDIRELARHCRKYGQGFMRMSAALEREDVIKAMKILQDMESLHAEMKGIKGLLAENI